MKPNIHCGYCKAELRWGDKFCGNCGKPVEWSVEDSAANGDDESTPGQSSLDQLACSTCGTVNKAGTEFCKSCGGELRVETKSETQRGATPARQGKKSQPSSRSNIKPLPFLNTWKPIAAVVVVVAAAVVFEMYSSKSNIIQQSAAQQTLLPQQSAGANMAVLPQIENMEKQLKANPTDMGLTLQLANFLNDNRFYDKAITYYKVYLQKNPENPNARVDMGICYKELGQFEDAKREMKKALEYDPKHLFATFNLGIVALNQGKTYMDQGEMDKANGVIRESNSWFKKTVELAPTSEVGKLAQQLLSQHSNTPIPQSN